MRRGRVRSRIDHALLRRGYRLVRVPAGGDGRVPPADLAQDAKDLFERVRNYTMTTPERVAALADAVRYLVVNKVPGAMVECGVWRGGSMMAVAHTLMAMGVDDRDLYLFDTFEGMPTPGEQDFDIDGVSAFERQAGYRRAIDTGGELPTTLQLLPMEEVRELMVATGYPAHRIHLVQGLVEDTIPAQAPECVALLRLDTDYYSSTRHEFEHLYPRVPAGGVVIVDDYAKWQGAKLATDEYLAEHGIDTILHRIDGASRMIMV
jgi:hypothetical protein